MQDTIISAKYYIERILIFAAVLVGLALIGSALSGPRGRGIAIANDKPAAAALAFNPPELSRAVVRITDDNGMSGTGFVVSGRRWIMTNHHVVKQGRRFYIRFMDRELQGRTAEARHFWSAPQTDLALLKATTDLPVEPLPVAFYKPLPPSDAYALGFPAVVDANSGPENNAAVSWAKGNITRVADGAPGGLAIEHSARTSPGSSGGPLLNACGHVIGVNAALIKDDRIGFVVSLAIPANELVLFLKLHRVPFELAQHPCAAGLGEPFDTAFEAGRLADAVFSRLEHCLGRNRLRPEICYRLIGPRPDAAAVKKRIRPFVQLVQAKQEERQRAQAATGLQRCAVARPCAFAAVCQRTFIDAVRGRMGPDGSQALRSARGLARSACERSQMLATPADLGLAAALLDKGRASLELNDIAAARLFFERAADLGLADAALELARTYDAACLAQRRIAGGIQPDEAQARKWYARAIALGSVEAAEAIQWACVR